MATTPKQQPVLYREIRDELLTQHKDEIAATLPHDMDPARFSRAFAQMVQASPQLQQCSKKSLIAVALRAALDGLLPDGRQGAVAAYLTDPGDGRRSYVAQWIPMIEGIRKSIDPYIAAGNAMIDDVIDPRETRPTVIKAFEMAQTKRVERPWKKHGVMPV